MRLAGANSLSGNRSRSITTPMAYFISSSSSMTSFPSLPTSGGCSRRRLTMIPSTAQAARHQGGRIAIETKSRAVTFRSGSCHAHDRQGQDHQVADHQGRAGPPKKLEQAT